MEQLILTADLEEDHIVGLSGKLNLNEFSGFGEACFNSDEISNFCQELNLLASEMEGTVELIGSQCKADGSEYLETLALRCSVLSSTKLNGIIGVHIILADYPYTDCRNEEIRKMSGELQIRNHKIKEFSDSLLLLVNGNQNEVILNGGLGI